MTGQTIGTYRVLHEIGRGGMGVVYLAEHRHLGRKVAIKFLLREFSDRPELLSRFFAEARAATLVEHPAIVQVLDCDQHPSGQAYIVMELLEGQTLRAYLAARGRLPFPEAAAIVIEIADALAAAHAKEIIHRDLKPDNVFLLSNPPGRIKIVDFGIAKLAGSNRPSATQSGAMLGTPLYMSPEQARGSGTVDSRTDIYSLGCMLFELVCGRPPFVFEGVGELISAHLNLAPPPPESLEPSLPPSLSAVCKRMLAKNPAERPPSMPAVISSLKAFSTGRGSGLGTVVAGGYVAPARTPTPPLATQGLPLTTPLPPPQRPPVVSETTMRQATGELTAPVATGRWRWALLGALVAALGAGGVVWMGWPAPAHREPVPVSVPEPPPSPRPFAPAVAPEPAAPEPAAPEPSPAPAPSPPPVKPASPPVRATIAVSIESEPAGADVCLDGRSTRVGVAGAPFELKRTHRKYTVLVYRLGYAVEELHLPGDRDTTRTVKLRRLASDDLQEPPPCGK